MKTKQSLEEEITEIDENLSLLRDNWLVCSPKNKNRYLMLINKLLDERLIVMKKRDETKPKKKNA